MEHVLHTEQAFLTVQRRRRGDAGFFSSLIAFGAICQEADFSLKIFKFSPLTTASKFKIFSDTLIDGSHFLEYLAHVLRKKQLVVLTFNSNRMPSSILLLRIGCTDSWEIFNDTHPNVSTARGGMGQYAELVALKWLILRSHWWQGKATILAAVISTGVGGGGVL